MLRAQGAGGGFQGRTSHGVSVVVKMPALRLQPLILCLWVIHIISLILGFAICKIGIIDNIYFAEQGPVQGSH